MQINFFNVPLIEGCESMAEMNRFLAGHKILEVEQHFLYPLKRQG